MDAIDDTLTGRRTNILGPPIELEGITGDDDVNAGDSEEGIDDIESEGIVEEEVEKEEEGICAESGEGKAVPLS